MSDVMFVLATTTLIAFIQGVTGTPYVTGGDSPAGTDCSGLASWVSNLATGRPAYGNRFHTSNEEAALLARGFRYGTGGPGDLVIGWNGGHTAVTLPDGTPVSSGEHGGVAIGGLGAYQKQFNHHMFLPLDGQENLDDDSAPADQPPPAPADLPAPADPPAPAAGPVVVQVAHTGPVPATGLAPAPPAAADDLV